MEGHSLCSLCYNVEHSVIWHISTNVKAPFKSGQIQPHADWSHLNMISIFALDCVAKGMQSTNVNTHKVRLFFSCRVGGISGLAFLDGNWESGWVSILQFDAQDCSHATALQSYVIPFFFPPLVLYMEQWISYIAQFYIFLSTNFVIFITFFFSYLAEFLCY